MGLGGRLVEPVEVLGVELLEIVESGEVGEDILRRKGGAQEGEGKGSEEVRGEANQDCAFHAQDFSQQIHNQSFLDGVPQDHAHRLEDLGHPARLHLLRLALLGQVALLHSHFAAVFPVLQLNLHCRTVLPVVHPPLHLDLLVFLELEKFAFYLSVEPEEVSPHLGTHLGRRSCELHELELIGEGLEDAGGGHLKAKGKLEHSRKQMAAQVQNCCIYVGNLPPSATPEDLYAFFSTFGEIKSIDLPKQPLTKKPRGFAFVEFDEHEDAMAAIDNYEGTEFKGRNLKVRKSKQSQMRQNYHKAVWDNQNWLQQNNAREAAEADRLQQMAKDDIYAS